MMDCLNISMTNLTEAGGCGCKLDAKSLQALLKPLYEEEPSHLIGGFDSSEDCAIIQLNDSECLLLTTDFFTPLIDDFEVFGSLAAAHAMSDIYAKGGYPDVANVILGFDPKSLPIEAVQSILLSGKKTLKKHGCVIGGGHTIVNPQPIYGFSIIGHVPRSQLKFNHSAKEGDILLLTKPLGSGVLSSALKLGLASSQDYEKALPILLEVNSCGRALGCLEGVHAMTDVTGFGLIGHALEMAEGASLHLQLNAGHIQYFDGMADLVEAVIAPESGIMKNYRNTLDKVLYKGTWKNGEQYIYSDPQTNGGLLVAVSPSSLSVVQKVLLEQMGREALVIGQFMSHRQETVRLEIVK